MPDDKRPIILNGRFLSAKQSGVQRVARQVLLALANILQDNPGYFGDRPVLLAVPPGVEDLKIFAPIKMVPVGGLRGQLWEQISLPRFARGGILVSLCNLTPIAARGILMIHDAQVYLTPQSYSWAFRKFYLVVQPLMARRSRQVLTVSAYSRDMLVRYKVARAENISVIHNGVDHILQVRPDVDALTALGLGGSSYVLAISSTQPHKNIGVLLRAFATPVLSGAKLVLAGAATAAEFAKAGYACPENVLFTGKIGDGALRALMEGATCLAFPSTTEGFGLPPMEAMILGCPAVVSSCGAMPEICGNAAIYVAPDDVAGWAQALGRLLGAPEHKMEIGRRAMAHAAKFTWARSALQLAAILRDMVD